MRTLLLMSFLCILCLCLPTQAVSQFVGDSTGHGTIVIIPNRVQTASDTNTTDATRYWVLQRLAEAGLIDRVKLSPSPLRYGLFASDSTLSGGVLYGNPTNGTITIFPGPDLLPQVILREEVAGHEPYDSAKISINTSGQFVFTEYSGATTKTYMLASFDSTRTIATASRDSSTALRTNMTNILNGTYTIPAASIAGVALYVGWNNVGAKPSGLDHAAESLAVHRTDINNLMLGGTGGTSYFSGSGAPSSGLGTDGSTYWDTAALIEYRKLGGVWRQQP